MDPIYAIFRPGQDTSVDPAAQDRFRGTQHHSEVTNTVEKVVENVATQIQNAGKKYSKKQCASCCSLALNLFIFVFSEI